MARLSDEAINSIKQDVSLVHLVESQGHQLKKHGKDFAICCPWHDDKTPSLIISPDKNLWTCKAGCMKGGSVIDWVMKTQSVDFRSACEILLKKLGLSAESNAQAIKHKPASKPPLAAHADNQAALSQVIDYYHETLKQTPEAQAYLAARGLEHPDLIEKFKLGYANRTLCHRIPEKTAKPVLNYAASYRK